MPWTAVGRKGGMDTGGEGLRELEMLAPYFFNSSESPSLASINQNPFRALPSPVTFKEGNRSVLGGLPLQLHFRDSFLSYQITDQSSCFRSKIVREKSVHISHGKSESKSGSSQVRQSPCSRQFKIKERKYMGKTP